MSPTPPGERPRRTDAEGKGDPLAASLVLLRAVHVLHGRGAESIAVFPYLSPTGLYWRCRLVIDGNMPDDLAYTSANLWALPGNPDGKPIDAVACADKVWGLVGESLRVAANRPHPDYVEWYAGLLDALSALGDALPILYDDSPGPAPFELGHLQLIRPAHGRDQRQSTYPLPPGSSLATLLGRDPSTG